MNSPAEPAPASPGPSISFEMDADAPPGNVLRALAALLLRLARSQGKEVAPR
jgi:hypothetical protein